MSLPNEALEVILHHYGVLEATQKGLRNVSRQWDDVLRHHKDWETVCHATGIGNVSRPDGEVIDWGGRYLSYLESCHTRSKLMAAVMRRKNVFMTGQGGTGKTVLIKLLHEKLTAMGNKAYVVATTGMAATLIGGTTIQRWAGVGLAKEEVPELMKRMGRDTRKRWRETDVLIIDEVSMLDPDLLVKFDEIGKRIRGSHLQFFGGIQIIASGDFLQLPPVKPEGGFQFVFQHPLWESGIDKTFVFKYVFRTTDALFTDILSRVRTSDHTMEDVEVLKTRLHAPLIEAEALGILPTQIYSLRADVDTYNRQKLDELEGDAVTRKAIVSVRRRQVDHTANSRYGLRYERAQRQAEVACPVASEMQYKDGAQVMLVVNLDPDDDLVNGSRGVITDVHAEGGIEVLFTSGEKRVIEPFGWKHNDARGDRGETITLTYKQMPLALAWAYTVHKSQGATLDCAVMDIGARIFQPGMAYVALSRVRSLKSFSLSSFDPTCMRADSLVRSYYAYLERFGTHKGFRATINRIPFPTLREMRGLVRQLPAITRRRKEAQAARKRATEQEQQGEGAPPPLKRVRNGV
jgi:ATP-dependent DNA helicase PIF1